MPVVKALIQMASREAVQPARDERLPPRDELRTERAGGVAAMTSGIGAWPTARTAYLIVVVLVLAATLIDAFSKAEEIGWRLGTPGNLWEPMLWNGTSVVVILALLPLVRRAAALVRDATGRWPLVALGVLGLAVAFTAIHVAAMFPLRKLAYALAGWDYAIRWTWDRILYEVRKDLFHFAGLTLVFWFAEWALEARRPLPADPGSPATSADPQAAPELWLNDGRASILIDPGEIVSVTSAGNYVEYVLTGGRRHLIRATLQAEATRLLRFGIARVHRTRLVNVKRVVALAWRASGDFELRLDTGEVVTGSRRYKAAVAAIGETG
jgi:LytTr DNA-binding domain